MTGRYDGFDFLKVDVRDGVAYLRIDRPERHNACDLDDHGEFARVLRVLASDDEVRAAVVTGKGPSFSVGGDLDLMSHLLTGPEADLERLHADAHDLVLAHVELDKPIVAGLHGHAMGSGAAFALFCDYIVMEEGAVLADGHMRAALAAGDGGALIWPLAAGLTTAKKYLLTGDGVDAAEALRIGLVSEVVPAGQAAARAAAVAQRFAAGPTQAIRSTKRVLNLWLRNSLATFEESLAAEVATLRSAETRDAIDALRTQRRPAIPPA